MAKKAKTVSATPKVGAVWSLAQIDAAIASIAKRGVALRVDSHKCLVAVIDHYIAHGDFTRLPKLLIAIKTSLGGSIAQSAAEWVQRYVTSLGWSEDAAKDQKKAAKDHAKPELDCLGFFHIPKVEKKIKENVQRTIEDAKGRKVVVTVESAREIPYYELERDVPIKPIDLIASLQAVLKRAQKAHQQMHDKDYEGPKHLMNDAQFEVLQKMEETIESLKVSKRKSEAAKKASADAAPKIGDAPKVTDEEGAAPNLVGENN